MSSGWAARNSFPTPMPIIPPPKYCSRHPQECQQKMMSAEQYWYNNVLNDVIKSTGANVQLALPPKSNTVGHDVWFKYWRRFADILKVNEYPQPPKRQERNEWSAYWKGLLKHGQYWSQHPPPPNYPNMKGYKAWVDEFKPCMGAGCGVGAEAQHAKHGVKRFLKKVKKGIKKVLHLDGGSDKRRQEEERRRREQHLAQQGQPQAPHLGQAQGYNQLGPRAPQPPPSSYEYNRQRSSGPSYGQASIDINRQAQVNLGRTGPPSHPSYSLDINRQASYGVHGGSPYYGGLGGQGSTSFDRSRQVDFSRESDTYGRQFAPGQRSFDVTGQVSFDVTRQAPYQQQQQQQQRQQRYGDVGRHSSHQASYGRPYDFPFDPFESVGGRGSSHYPPRGYDQDPFASINRQIGRQSCQRSSFTPPPDTVFHGHHAQLGPVYRSTTGHPHPHPHQQQRQSQAGKLRYYIERNGTLTEVSGEIFHELRCESSQMTCCAPHCDEGAYKHHGQQHKQGQYGGTPSGPSPVYRRGIWGPTSRTSTGASRTSSSSGSSTKDTSSGGGILSSLTSFWNEPADWHERERRWKHGRSQTGGPTTTHGGQGYGQGHYNQGQSSQAHWGGQQYGQQPGGQASYERSVTYSSHGQPAPSGYGQASWSGTSYHQQQQQQPGSQGSWNVAVTSGQPTGRSVSVERSVSYSSGSGQAPPPPSSFSYNQQRQQGGAGGFQQQQQVPPSSFSYNQQH